MLNAVKELGEFTREKNIPLKLQKLRAGKKESLRATSIKTRIETKR